PELTVVLPPTQKIPRRHQRLEPEPEPELLPVGLVGVLFVPPVGFTLGVPIDFCWLAGNSQVAPTTFGVQTFPCVRQSVGVSFPSAQFRSVGPTQAPASVMTPQFESGLFPVDWAPDPVRARTGTGASSSGLAHPEIRKRQQTAEPSRCRMGRGLARGAPNK